MAHVIRHDQGHVKSPHRRHHRERDPGVTAGRLDEAIAGFDFTARLGAADHAAGGAILYRTRRIVAFEFDRNTVAAAGAETLQCDQWCISDIILQKHIKQFPPVADGISRASQFTLMQDRG